MATQPVYATTTAFTLTGLADLANDALWQSNALDNSTLLYMAVDIFVAVATDVATEAADALGYVNVYMAESPDGGTDFSGQASGTAGSYSPTGGAAEHQPNLRFLGRINAPADEVDTSSVFKKNFRVHDLPDNFSIVIENKMGAEFNATGNNVEYQGINFADA